MAHDDERISRLERRVRELQTAMVAIVRHLEIEEEVAIAERARLDEIRAKGDDARDRLLDLYRKPRP
jgi:hypothetical protein